MTTLEASGIAVMPIDSSRFSRIEKAALAGLALAQGHPWQAAQRLDPALGIRGRWVERQATVAGVDHVICCGTMDVPFDGTMPYSVWLDNSWDLLTRSAVDQGFPARTNAQVDERERRALLGAARVLTFSEHLRDNIISHYDVPAEKVVAVGCGSGEVPPFEGSKDYQSGHLLFVAKHLFAEKGGELALQALDQVRQTRPQTRLVIVGTEAKAAELQGREGVEAHGFVSREKLNELFHGAAMLVQPMIADPWGQVYLEAMKAKAIVVALNVAAVPEITENGALAALADAPTPEALASAILQTYSRSNAEISAIADRAQARVQTLYGWPMVAERIVAAIHSAV